MAEILYHAHLLWAVRTCVDHDSREEVVSRPSRLHRTTEWKGRCSQEQSSLFTRNFNSDVLSQTKPCPNSFIIIKQIRSKGGVNAHCARDVCFVISLTNRSSNTNRSGEHKAIVDHSQAIQLESTYNEKRSLHGTTRFRHSALIHSLYQFSCSQLAGKGWH